jgi:DNA-binding XRE family transcriptional regulator
MSIEVKFKANLKNARRYLGFTKVKMSDCVGANYRSYQQWESSASIMPKLESFIKICDFLNLTADDMLLKELEFKNK